MSKNDKYPIVMLSNERSILQSITRYISRSSIQLDLIGPINNKIL